MQLVVCARAVYLSNLMKKESIFDGWDQVLSLPSKGNKKVAKREALSSFQEDELYVQLYFDVCTK